MRLLLTCCLLLLVICGLQAKGKVSAKRHSKIKHDKLRSVLNKKSTTKKSDAVVGAVVAVDKDDAPPSPPAPPPPLKKQKTAPPPEENPNPTPKHTKILMEPWRERKHYEPEEAIPPPKELVKLVKKAKQKQCGGRRCVTHEEPAPKNILPDLLNNPELLLAKAVVPKVPVPARAAPPAAPPAPARAVPQAAPPTRVAPPARLAPAAEPARTAPVKAPAAPKQVTAPEPPPEVLTVAAGPPAPPSAIEPPPPPAMMASAPLPPPAAMAALPPPAAMAALPTPAAMAAPTPAPFIFPFDAVAAPSDGTIHTSLSDDGDVFTQKDSVGSTETRIEMSKKRNKAPENPDAPRAKVDDSQRVAAEIAGQRSSIPFVDDE